ncbi:MAG TPA: MFS transporter [Pyrinomonadaceae bacterium]|nr:MFS transporter [Pyrinomonadaceae bacterium]
MSENAKKSILQPNISSFNLATLLFAAFASALMLFVSFGQEFVLTVFLKIPLEEQGVVGGGLQSVREIVVLFSIVLGGVLADKFGRRIIFATGFLLVAVGFFLFPFAINSTQLSIYYGISGIGAAFITGMLTTVLADYILPESRGKFTGLQAVFNTIGALFILFGVKRLPKFFADSGMEISEAGKITYYIVAGICVIVAVVLWLGLYKNRAAGKVPEKKGFLTILSEGILEARKPGVALAYFAGFISRGDLVVVGVFLTLWINKSAIASGMNAADATAKVGAILGIGAIGQLLFGFLIGWLVDLIGRKRSRVDSLAVAAFIGVIAYGVMGFITDPLGKGLMLAMILLAVAQIFGIIASQVFITQQARPEIRGSVIGFFGVCGALAQIILAYIGGFMFDKWSPNAPFVLVAILNVILLILCIVLRPFIKNETAETNEVVISH